MASKGTALVEVVGIDPDHPQRSAAPAKITPSTNHAARIYLQVGSFGDAANAQRLQRRLEDLLKRAVRIERGQVNGRTLHRVQIGPLPSVEVADQVVDRLEEINIYQTHLLLR